MSFGLRNASVLSEISRAQPGLTLEAGGIDDIVADLAAQGVTVVTPVSEAPGGWSADFLDPDGFGFWPPGDLPRSLK